MTIPNAERLRELRDHWALMSDERGTIGVALLDSHLAGADDVGHLVKGMHCLALELPEKVWRDACLPVIDYLQRTQPTPPPAASTREPPHCSTCSCWIEAQPPAAGYTEEYRYKPKMAPPQPASPSGAVHFSGNIAECFGGGPPTIDISNCDFRSGAPQPASQALPSLRDVYDAIDFLHAAHIEASGVRDTTVAAKCRAARNALEVHERAISALSARETP